MRVDLKLYGLTIDEQDKIVRYLQGKEGEGSKSVRSADDNGGGKIPYFTVSKGDVRGNPTFYDLEVEQTEAEFTDGGRGQMDTLKGLINLVSQLSQKT